MGTASVTIRAEESTKRAVRALAENFGFDISSIARAFYKQIERERKIPPSLARVPEARQEAAEINALRETNALVREETPAESACLPSRQP